MSGSVTPARRGRDEYEEEEEAEDVSVDGETSRLSGRKRARIENEGNVSGEGEGEEEKQGSEVQYIQHKMSYQATNHSLFSLLSVHYCRTTTDAVRRERMP